MLADVAHGKVCSRLKPLPDFAYVFADDEDY